MDGTQDLQLQSYTLRYEAGLRGYGNMLLQLWAYFMFCVRGLAWLIDVRRLLIVSIILVGLSLIAYLIAKEVALRSALTESRCYQAKQKYSRNSQSSAVLSKKGVNLLTVSYDMRARIARTACMCPGGNVMNSFPYFRFDFKTLAITRDSGNCMCDNDYVTLPESFVYHGTPNLVQFMQTGSVDDAKTMFGLVASTTAPSAPTPVQDASKLFATAPVKAFQLTTQTVINTGAGYKFEKQAMNYTTGFTMICRCKMLTTPSNVFARIFDFGYNPPASVALPQIGMRLIVNNGALSFGWNSPQVTLGAPSATAPAFAYNKTTVLALRYAPDSTSSGASGTLSLFVDGTLAWNVQASNVKDETPDKLLLGTDLYEFTNSSMTFDYFYWFTTPPPFTDAQIKAFV